jgi:hypothetical protein
LRPEEPRTDERQSGVFLADVAGVPLGLLGVASSFCSGAAAIERLTLVKPELTAVKPLELIAANPGAVLAAPKAGVSDMGTSFSESLE